MPYQLLETITFAGAATSRGASFDGFSQDGVTSDTWWKRSGSGTAVPDSPGSFKTYARKALTARRHRVEWDFGPWASGFRYQPAFRQTGTLLSGDKYAAYSLFLSNAQFGIRANHDTTLGTDTSLTPTVGDLHTLRAEFNGDGTSTDISATLLNTTTSEVLATSTVTGDTTAGLQGVGEYGWFGEPSFVPSGWELREIRVYEWIADTTAPTITSGQIHPSGNVASITASDATLPLTSATPNNLTGFTFEYRVVAGTGSWLSATVKNARISGVYGEKIAFALASVLPPTSEARVSYNSAVGDIQDSAETPNDLATFSNYGLTNNSTTTTGASSEGVQVIGTRGFARTSANTTATTGKEVATLTRHEFPYGAADGWKLAYLGYSDGTSSSLVVNGAAIWVQNPGEPQVRYPVTFNAGSATATIAVDTVQESDGLLALLPGAVVWSVSHVKPSSGSVNLPFTTFGYCRESATGLEDYDGVLSGGTGTVSTDCLLGGGFAHGAFATTETTLGLGGYAFRGYQPAALVGKCHPTYAGEKTAMAWIGDSINVQSNDYGEKVPGTLDPYAARGWNGRYCAARLPYVIFGQSGSVATGFINAEGTDIFEYLFGTTSGDSGTPKRKVTHLCDEYGVNSLRDSAQATGPTYSDMDTVLWTKRSDVADLVAQLDILYIMTTLTPVGASWIQGAMTIGQLTTERAQFNAKVRTDFRTITGCIGYLDLASAVETAQDNNTWISANDSDSIHPNPLGHDAMSGAFSLSFLRFRSNNVPGTDNLSISGRTSSGIGNYLGIGF